MVLLVLAMAGYAKLNMPVLGSVQKVTSGYSGEINAQNRVALEAMELKDKAVSVLPGVERKITRDVTMTIVAPNVEEAVSRIEEIIKDSGGYVQNANTWQENESMQGKLILRLPVNELDDVLPRLEKLGRVIRRNITAKDITEEYYDATTRQKTLESQEKRLLELINKANTVNEMLEIENELTRIRSQIESLQARLKVLDSLTDLATVTIEVQSPRSISIGETLQEPLGQRLKAGFQRGLNGMINSAEGLIVLLAILIPYTPVLLIAGYIIYRLWKKSRARSMSDSGDSGD